MEAGEQNGRCEPEQITALDVTYGTLQA